MEGGIETRQVKGDSPSLDLWELRCTVRCTYESSSTSKGRKEGKKKIEGGKPFSLSAKLVIPPSHTGELPPLYKIFFTKIYSSSRIRSVQTFIVIQPRAYIVGKRRKKIFSDFYTRSFVLAWSFWFLIASHFFAIKIAYPNVLRGPYLNNNRWNVMLRVRSTRPTILML